MIKSKVIAMAAMFIISGVIIMFGKCAPLKSGKDREETEPNPPDSVVSQPATENSGVGADTEKKSKPDADRIIEYCQYPDYPTGCESVSLYILLKYYGVKVTVNDIVGKLPKGPVPYGVIEVFGADPYDKFVGDPTDDRSYGVFNGPIRDVAEKFKEGAVAENLGDGTAEGIGKDLKAVIDEGSPVIVWIKREGFDGEVSWKNDDRDSERETILWIKGEHALVVYDYDDGGFWCSDPIEGAKVYIESDELLTGMSSFGGMCVYYPG